MRLRGAMRVLMLSKASIVGIYQPKLQAISRLGVNLKVLVPPSWKDERGEQVLERGGRSRLHAQVRFPSA